jgi:SAM-dependent methyltransferase
MTQPATQPLSREEILAGIERFPTWSYPFDLGQGIVVEPRNTTLFTKDPRSFMASHRPKRDAVLAACGGSLEGLSVLDCGCYQGYWTVEAIRAGASRAVGIDARPEHLEQARFVARALGYANASFEQADVFDVERLGTFDVVFLFGILYHVDSPVELLRRVRAVTRKLIVVDTDTLPLDEPVLQLRYEDTGMDLNSATAPLVMVPSVSAVVRMLRHAGFGDVRVVRPAPDGAPARFRWRRTAFLAAPRDPAKPDPELRRSIESVAGRHGERHLNAMPSAADRVPLPTVLWRKARRLFDPRRPPNLEAPLTDA